MFKPTVVLLKAIALALMTAVVSAACNSEAGTTEDCSRYFDPALTSVPFDSLRKASGRVWITTHYPSSSIYYEEDSVFGWRYEGREYSARFDEQPFKSSLIVFLNPQPTLDVVVRCLGKPDSYLAVELPTPEQRKGTQLTL